jgi:membrane associated rhomboid family serine protease
MTAASVGFHCPECLREGRGDTRAPRGGGLQAAGRRWGTVTLTLIGLNVAMFVITAAAQAGQGGNPLDNQNSTLFVQLAQIPLFVDAGEWWRVLSAAFLHFGPIHLALNMLALLVFGSELERQLGRWRFLGLYVVSILGGAVAIQLFSPLNSIAAGASTAIYGLFGGLGVLMIATKQDLRGLLTLLAINIVISLLPGVSLVGHLGGLVAGALVTALMILTRRRRGAQITAVVALGVLLFALALAVPTVVVLNI